MRLMLDTHALIWWFAGKRQLSATARAAIGDEANQIFVSAASAWEIATKFRLGKLPKAAALAVDIVGAIASQDFVELAITVAHAQRAGGLSGPTKDPFDRMLIAQALTEDMALLTNEEIFDRYGIQRVW